MPEKLRILLNGETPLEPFQYSNEVRSLVYRWLSYADAKLATAFHDENQVKPFSIGPIHSDSEHPGRMWFDIFSLSDVIIDVIMQGLIKSGMNVELAEHGFSIAGMERCYRISYKDILAGCADGPKLNEFHFEVQTPAAHHARGMFRKSVVTPSERYFGSWLRRWQLFSGVGLPSSLSAILHERMAVSFFSGTTQLVELNRKDSLHREEENDNRKFIGFVGKVSFEVLKPGTLSKEELVSIAALARFSEYSGVGVETMRGMGRIRYMRE